LFLRACILCRLSARSLAQSGRGGVSAHLFGSVLLDGHSSRHFLKDFRGFSLAVSCFTHNEEASRPVAVSAPFPLAPPFSAGTEGFSFEASCATHDGQALCQSARAKPRVFPLLSHHHHALMRSIVCGHARTTRPHFPLRARSTIVAHKVTRLWSCKSGIGGFNQTPEGLFIKNISCFNSFSMLTKRSSGRA